LLVSATIFQRFGVGSADFTVSPALLAGYLLVAVGILAQGFVISASRLALYLAGISVAVISALLNENRASFTSLLLLVVVYLPFVFVLEEQALARSDADWLMRHFSTLCFICAGAGIAQFFLQFVVHGEWLFDFTRVLPDFMRTSGTFNTVISVGSFNKSNGFFFREPSGFSFLMALALIVESVSQRRVGRIAAFAFALLLTYSGTGILLLLIGASYPLGAKTLLRLGVVLCVGAVLFALFDDTLNLSYTFSRVSEFDSTRSSGYIRYIAPGRLLGELFTSEPWSPWFGHGPGTIFRTAREYEFHDPTWAKALFEYGLLGFGAFVALFAEMLRRPGIPIQIRATLFWAWLITGGHLLAPEQNYLTLALVGILPFAARLSRSGEPDTGATESELAFSSLHPSHFNT
jgi:hypothetical protein